MKMVHPDIKPMVNWFEVFQPYVARPLPGNNNIAFWQEQNGWVCATDLKMAVRVNAKLVPEPYRFPHRPDFPNMSYLDKVPPFPRCSINIYEWRNRLAMIPKEMIYTRCFSYLGSGKRYSEACDVCEGTGHHPTPLRYGANAQRNLISIRNIDFDPYHIERMLKTLEQLEQKSLTLFGFGTSEQTSTWIYACFRSGDVEFFFTNEQRPAEGVSRHFFL